MGKKREARRGVVLYGSLCNTAIVKMRILGSSDLKVSTLALGTMTIGREVDEEGSFRLLDQYVGSGGNFIDSADRYSMGACEEIIGRWLKKSGRRDSLVIATKARNPMPRGSGLHPDYLRGAIEDNLMRLDIDTLDIFQPHAFDPAVHPAEWLGLMKELVAEGKIRYVGVSNFLGYQLQQTLEVARYENLPMVVSLQSQYNLLDRNIELDAADVARSHQIPLLAWSPLAGGWLSGKYQRDRSPTGQNRLGEDVVPGPQAYEKRNNSRTFDVLDEVARIAREIGCTMAQVSIAWLLKSPLVGSVILGARTPDQLVDNVAAADVKLSDGQWSSLEEISRPVAPDYPYGFLDLLGGR